MSATSRDERCLIEAHASLRSGINRSLGAARTATYLDTQPNVAHRGLGSVRHCKGSDGGIGKNFFAELEGFLLSIRPIPSFSVFLEQFE